MLVLPQYYHPHTPNMTPASTAALSSDSLLSLMSRSLPKQIPDAKTPILKDSYAAIALFSHACMLAVGFRLIGLGEDHRLGMEYKELISEPKLITRQRCSQIRTNFTPCPPNGTHPLLTPFVMRTPSPQWNIW
jgi:PI31 proteasome regulator N-terminal